MKKLLGSIAAVILAGTMTLPVFAATNTLTYNAKNEVTSGTYTEPDPPDEAHYFMGWSTDKNATAPDTSIKLTPNDVTNAWLNSKTDKSTTTLYAVWGEKPAVYYAVSIYGIGIDTVADDSKGTNERVDANSVTFGPAKVFQDGVPLSNYYPFIYAHKVSDSTYLLNAGNTGSTTEAMVKADMDAVQPENEPAITDESRNVIVGTDAGKDSSGNAYRCIHYDNWNTILYWIKKDPHVYDKCIDGDNRQMCTKRIILSPGTESTDNAVNGFDWHLKSDYRYAFQGDNAHPSFYGDGISSIGDSIWDNGYQSADEPYKYKYSTIRAKLIGDGSDVGKYAVYTSSNTSNYSTELTKDFYSSLTPDKNSYLGGFPKKIRNAMVYKKVDGDNTYTYDKLWLFQKHEVRDWIETDDSGTTRYHSAIYGSKIEGTGDEFWLNDRLSGEYAKISVNRISCDKIYA